MRISIVVRASAALGAGVFGAGGCGTGSAAVSAPETAPAPAVGTGPAPNPAAAQVSATLSPTERAIVAGVDTRSAEGLALLERLVNINSGTMNFAGVRQVGAILRQELDALGFQTRWVDGSPFNRAGHLVAERTGSGPRLLLIGHLDTVFDPTSHFQKYEKVTDSTARGPGVIDMKGGDVIMLQALKALRAAGVLESMSITAVFSGDEEDAGRPLEVARADLIAAAKKSRYAIGFEDGSGDPRTAVISRRGTSSWILTSTGTPAHSSQIFRADIGAGAIFESARALDQLRSRLSSQQYLTFNPGYAIGGTDIRTDSTQPGGIAFGKTNVIAKAMRVTGDIRALSPEQLARTKTAMLSIAAASLPRTSSTIVFDDGYPPLAPTEGNRRLLATYDKVSRDLGYWPVVAVDPMRAGAADVSFAAPHITAALDAIGLAGWDDHTDKETADLRMFVPLTQRAALFLYRLSTAAPQ
ncbi:MAG TPA: M20/M25/M40 family metallo-hydrolase [Gemmatimonadaceae bacterium]|nr:M20/M25/M40 family metallo-hydrolase [Gemmatimonadaceae bacterium]